MTQEISRGEAVGVPGCERTPLDGAPTFRRHDVVWSAAEIRLD